MKKYVSFHLVKTKTMVKVLGIITLSGGAIEEEEHKSCFSEL